MVEPKAKRFQFPRHWTLAQRLAHFTAPPNHDGCRLWTGRTLLGYGRVAWKRKIQLAHRLVWMEANGPIPKGVCVCHTCDVRNCVSLQHLWLGTQIENVADRDAKNRASRGEAHYRVKLTQAQAMAIFSARGTQQSIADAFEISRSVVCHIKGKRIWKHIHGDASKSC